MIPLVALWTTAAVFLLLWLVLTFGGGGTRQTGAASALAGTALGPSLITPAAIFMTGALIIHALRRQ